MRVGRIADRLHVRQAKSVSAGGDGVRSIPIWAMWSIAVAALLSPVLALLMAIAAEILIGSLMDAGLPVLLPLAIAGVLAWLLLRRRSSRPEGRHGPEPDVAPGGSVAISPPR